MRHLKSDVGTVSFGGAMGMAAFLLCSGTKGKRVALAHTRLMMHLPSGAARGTSTDMWNETRELIRIRGYMVKCLQQQTGQTEEKLVEVSPKGSVAEECHWGISFGAACREGMNE